MKWFDFDYAYRYRSLVPYRSQWTADQIRDLLKDEHGWSVENFLESAKLFALLPIWDSALDEVFTVKVLVAVGQDIFPYVKAVTA